MFRKFISKLSGIAAVAVVTVLSLALILSTSSVPVATAVTPKPNKINKRTLEVKLSANSGVTLDAKGNFTGGAADQTQQLNTLLNNAKRVKTAKLKQGNAKSALQGKLDKSLEQYYEINFKEDVDMPKLVQQLSALNIVEVAYAEPTPAPAPTSPSYAGLQNYLNAAPEGMDSNYAQTFPGGKGEKVAVYDLEYSWNTAHEDLTMARTAFMPNGTPVDPFNDSNHGTAAVGPIIADNNSYGVSGMASNATLRLINTFNDERGYDLVNALYMVGATAAPGDVVLIEQQAWGPTSETYDFVPVEWIPAVYDAISTLTANGIIVIEPAGNGNQNLNDTTYYGSPFPMGKPDSGALIVGAGHNCAPASEFDTDMRRSRLGNSTYGSRVNVQGPGTCVTSTGYGDLYSATGIDSFYTSSWFNSTSAASAVVAAAVASLSSSYETLNGVTLNPAQAKSLLLQTGTTQNTTAPGALAGNIGAYPNLAKALPLADKTGPTKPANVRVALNSSKQPVVSWDVATDNLGVKGYKLYRNGVLYRTVYANSFTDTNVKMRKSYSYYVVAFDANGNNSVASQTVSITVR